MRAPLILALSASILAAGFGAQAARGPDAKAFADAVKEAREANARVAGLERQAQGATNAADRARRESTALAGRIDAAEADLTTAQRRIAMIEGLQAVQRARLAERQQPLIRLTAALQMMARRPPAMALVQPGSVDDTVHIRSLLAATLPEIRRRTAALRVEVDRANQLRRGSEAARAALLASREQLRGRRAELAAFEAAQRARSVTLSGLALAESDRALVFGEEARTLAQELNSRAYQARLASSLAQLPEPLPRPVMPGARDERPSSPLPYMLPVEGRVLTGVGEISDGGVHARGLTLATAPDAEVRAPASGRIVHAGPFRSYGNVIIIDHGQGWSTVITSLAALDVERGAVVRRGAALGRASTEIGVELRRNGRPVPIAQLIAG